VQRFAQRGLERSEPFLVGQPLRDAAFVKQGPHLLRAHCARNSSILVTLWDITGSYPVSTDRFGMEETAVLRIVIAAKRGHNSTGLFLPIWGVP
jgi:hypothetical protein